MQKRVALARAIAAQPDIKAQIKELKIVSVGEDFPAQLAAIEEVKAVKGAILGATRRDALNRSTMRKLIAGAAYKELTARNLNTTLKLRDLLAG